ncbi:MAG: hypothetical protein PWQ41_2012 [Bacillota bacterium]|nr:hypothetical protein [Bacillota bacterium]MDK2960577.1 hypothetical protein [Bacillota bacterium]
METVIYDRHKLYEEVWTEPVSVVAKRYGISDVALRKHCKKLNVPLPPKGYWSQIRAGLPAKRPPLPKHLGEDRIVVFKYGSGEQKRIPKQSERLAFLSKEEKDRIISYTSSIRVPDELTEPHILVKDTIQFKKSRKPSLSPPRDNVLSIDTSEEQFSRALRIMDTILRAAEDLGYRIKNTFMETMICIGEEEIKIGIREKKKRIDHELTAEEREHEAKYGYAYAPKYDYKYVDQLCLYIDNWKAKRKNWNDTKSKRVEDEIGDFIITLVETAEELRLERIKRREEEQRRLAEERRRLQLQMMREEELDKLKELEEKVSDYRRAMGILEYVSALEEAMQALTDERKRKELQEYIAWAKAKANWLNPLVNSEDPILGVRG